MEHQPNIDGSPVDAGPAPLSDGPDIDLDGMRVRPMHEAASSGKAKGKGTEQGWLERMRSSITADYGFQKARKRPAAKPKKPDFSLLEIFYRYADDKNGQPRKLSIKERFLRGYQMGRWMVDNGLGKAAALAERLLMRGKYAPEPFDPLPAGDLAINAEDDSRKFEDHIAQGEAKARESKEGPDFWKRDDEPRGAGTSASTDRVWIYPTRQDTSYQVASERVGPERQVRRNDGPWPLPRPTAKEMPDRHSLPKPEADGPKDGSGVPGGTPKSKGEAASDRGRAAAHDVHARKTENQAGRGRDLRDTGAER